LGIVSGVSNWKVALLDISFPLDWSNRHARMLSRNEIARMHTAELELRSQHFSIDRQVVSGRPHTLRIPAPVVEHSS
jgi:hypothetical protein